MDIERVLEDYRNGDEGRRVSLFLAHRDLRDEFNRIEQEPETEQTWGPEGATWLEWILGCL